MDQLACDLCGGPPVAVLDGVFYCASCRPEEESESALTGAPIDVLLRSAYSLTHRIHAARAKRDDEKEQELRGMRDQIDQEITRRTGEGS